MEKTDVQSTEELDFVSPKFNPLAVLNAEGLEPPCPEISGFNSLREYEMVVREKRQLPSSTFSQATLPAAEQDSGSSKVKSSSTLRVEFLEGENTNPQTLGVVDCNKDLYIVPYRGPLGLLQQWYRINALVRVWIRHSAGVRGVCSGRLVAFDKHWNIVLIDVEETFVPFDARNLKRIKKKKKRKSKISDQVPPNCLQWTPCDQTASSENSQSEDRTDCASVATPPEASGYKLGYCTELYRKSPLVRVRAVDQLFIRGDNIVLIAAKTQSHNT